MGEGRTPTANPRRRNLAILAGAAVISVVLALLALREQAAELAPKYVPETFLPGFAAEIANVDRISVSGSKGSFDIVRTPSGWVLPNRSDYPAAFGEVRKTLVGLAGLETIEPKTARPDWYQYVGLETPPKGTGVLITVTAEGRKIASVIFGKTQDIGDASGALGLFARRAGDSQSWLLRSVFQPKSDISDWLDKNVISVDRARIQDVAITPESGPAYSVRRDKPSDPDFMPSSLPRGRALNDPAAADSVASAITGFTFDDVRPQAELEFSKATRVVTKTFDGLTVAVNVIQRGADYWATLSAAAEPSSKDADTEAREINARAGRWAYKLPAYKGQQFLTSLESLLKPVGTTNKPAP